MEQAEIIAESRKGKHLTWGDRQKKEAMAKGVIRRFIAKSHDIAEFTWKRIKETAQWINNYPRRILDYSSPLELFNNKTIAIA